MWSSQDVFTMAKESRVLILKLGPSLSLSGRTCNPPQMVQINVAKLLVENCKEPRPNLECPPVLSQDGSACASDVSEFVKLPLASGANTTVENVLHLHMYLAC